MATQVLPPHVSLSLAHLHHLSLKPRRPLFPPLALRYPLALLCPAQRRSIQLRVFALYHTLLELAANCLILTISSFVCPFNKSNLSFRDQQRKSHKTSIHRKLNHSILATHRVPLLHFGSEARQLLRENEREREKNTLLHARSNVSENIHDGLGLLQRRYDGLINLCLGSRIPRWRPRDRAIACLDQW